MTQTRGGFGSCPSCSRQRRYSAATQRVEQRLQEVELLAVGEDDVGDPRAVDRAVLAEDALPQLVDHRLAHLVVGGEQVVDDLVARDGGGAGRERRERLALAGADAAGDGDGDRVGRRF